MKYRIEKRIVAVILSLIMAVSLMSVGFSASAYHYDDDTINSYEDLNCAEDDCDCLEPDENVFKVVSPVSGSAANANYAEVVFTGAFHEVQEYFRANGQTDGMTVIPPTTLKVEKFMRYIPEGDTDVVATVSSTGRVITAYQVAVNAVMSGCSAEYMPICIAFTKAFNNAEYVASLEDGSLTPMAFVNGPLARQLGIDNQQGMTTEEANIALGRFIEFSLINLAGIKRSTSFGYMQPLVFSENDKACLDIGWKPYNVEKGYGLNETTVTASSFSMWGNNVTPATDLPEEIMKVIAWDITEKNLGGLGAADSDTYADTKRVVFITPQVASALSALYKDKSNLEDALVEAAVRPMWMRAYAYFYANTGANLTGKSLSEVYANLMSNSKEKAKVTASPDWLIGITAPEIATGKTMAKGNTIFLVTGDDSRNKTQVMPGGVSVINKAECSAMYETLVTSMNYQPIENYYLTATDFTVTPPESVPSVLTNGTYRILDPSTGATYLTRTGRVYFDSSTNTLHYYAVGATSASSVVLDSEKDADFIAYLENLGINSSFKVTNGKLKEATIRFSSNASKPDTNASALTKESFNGITLSLHANNTENSLAAGGIAKDGATVTMSADVNSFDVSLDGDIAMGGSTTVGFVTLSGSSLTLNTNAPAGSKAIIGSANSDGTYRTLTFEMKADGTYKITYNTSGTLSLEDSNIYLKGTFNDWEATDAFKKTNTKDVYSITKEFAAGTYSFKVNEGSIWYGNTGTFTDSAMRWEMGSSVSADCTFIATGGTYTFAWDNAAKRLTVSKEIENLPDAPACHQEEVIKGYAPTCTEEGLTDGTICSICGEVLVAQEVIPVTDHQWSNGICTSCGKKENSAKVEGYSVSLSGNIGVNFHFTLSEDILNDSSAKVVFTLPNGSKKSVPVSGAEIDEDGYYVFTCEVVAKEMTADIKAQIETSESASDVFIANVQKYAEVILKNEDSLPEYTKAQPLVKAMLNYGASTQAYFGYKVDNLANSILSDAEKLAKKADFSNYQFSLTGKSQSLSYYGSRLTLESETAIKHYFNLSEGVEVPEFKINGEVVPVTRFNNYCEIKITNIPAQSLHNNIEVTADGITLSYGVFSYAYLASTTGNAELNSVMNAIFAYNQAAIEYAEN